MEPNQIIDIPADVGVRCPRENSCCIPLRKCEGCEHCGGLNQAFANDKLHFSQQYMVRCAYPVDRELMQLRHFGGAE